MTGFRASTLRKTCKHCKTTFKPKRADAEFCCGLCRQAHHRVRTKRQDEIATVAFKLKRREEALAVIDDLDRFRSAAALCHERAENRGMGLRFMATRIGVLAVETLPGALSGAKNPLCGREVQTRSDDPRITALLSLETFGGPYFYQVAERECRAALMSGTKDVKLYIQDWDYWADELRKQPVQYLPALESMWPTSDDYEYEEDYRGDLPVGATYDGDLSDGFQVIDSRHQSGCLDD
ncbi:hypothetical protein [Bradyrhizobium sp. JR18.2]|uniref:hypothetical protein n=1 Tax=Bradyrhizobium sp. JR18.2 TaxID=3156369 RepID=UPI00339AC930